MLALLRSQVGGVHVIHGTFGDEARLEHGTQIRKHEILKALLADVVKQKRSNHVAGEWNHVVTLEPGTFAGTGKPNGEDDNAFGRTRRGRRHCRGNTRRLRRGEGFRFDSVGRTLFGRFLWQIGDDAFRGGGTEGLSDGLLATASTSSASSSSPTSASPAFSASALRARWLAGVGGLFARGLPFNLSLIHI